MIYPSEFQVQKAYMEWLKYFSKEVFDCAIHVANERKTSLLRGKNLKDLGVKPGFPDVFIFYPSGHYYGLAIEIKANKRNLLSTNQQNWLNLLNTRGYFSKCCVGLDDCITTTEKYFQR